MGGFGSGKRSNRWRVEDCSPVISLPGLLRHGVLPDSDKRTTINHMNGDRFLYSLEITARRISEDRMTWFVHNTGQLLQLHSTLLNFGGCRWWLECSKCARRCSKLYMLPQGSMFACRLCHNLWYRSTANNDDAAFAFLGGDFKSAVEYLEAGARQRFLRKRDRRKDYRSREGWKVYNLKRTKKGRAIIQGMLALYAKTKRVASLQSFAQAIESGSGEPDNRISRF